jgi:glutathione S-transferase
MLRLVAAVAAGGVIGFLIAATKSKAAPQAGAKKGKLTLGYWKIRGLCAPLRMMCFYAGEPFTNKAYGEDAKDEWFGKEKNRLKASNALINLPYVIEGPTAADPKVTVVTQSNSCLLWLGQRLGIDKPEHAVHNHQALDQVMDLRNDTMKIVYGFSKVVPSKDEFPAGLAKHMQGAATHLTKLEGHCVGPFMCGAAPQSSDFHVFEMFDQHVLMCEQTGVPFDFAQFPKLSALHRAMKSDPALATYFASDFYCKYAFNNAMYTFFCGAGYGDGPFGPTLEEAVKVR